MNQQEPLTDTLSGQRQLNKWKPNCSQANNLNKQNIADSLKSSIHIKNKTYPGQNRGHYSGRQNGPILRQRQSNACQVSPSLRSRQYLSLSYRQQLKSVKWLGTPEKKEKLAVVVPEKHSNLQDEQNMKKQQRQESVNINRLISQNKALIQKQQDVLDENLTKTIGLEQRLQIEGYQYYLQSQLQQAEQLLQIDQLSCKQLQKILKNFLKRTPKCNRVKWIIATALKKEIKQQKQSEISAPAIQQQKQLPQWIQSYNQVKKIHHEQRYIYSSQYNYANPTDLQKFIDILSQFQLSDYSYMFRLQSKLQQMVDQILAFWDAYKPTFQPYFERFLDLMKIKIEFISESKCIYYVLYQIKNKLQIALDYKGSRRNIRSIDDHLTDLLFQHYMQELQTRSSRNGVYYVRDSTRNEQRVPLSEFIANCKEYFSTNSSWKDIFSIITQVLQKRDAGYDPKSNEIKQLFVSNLPNAALPFSNCLGCSQYFYMNQNIYSPEVCESLLVLVGPITQISNNAANIKDEICALLNGKGGVLLFDCSKTYNKIISRGSFIIEIEKQQIQQKITVYLDGIYPRPQINRNIFISWVPIVEDPFQIKPNSNSRPILNFIEGLFVLRVTVKPTFGHITYFWTQQQKPIFSVRTESLFQSGKRQVSGRRISSLMKHKFKNFSYQLKDMEQIQLVVVEKVACCMNHPCKKPNVGIQISQRRVQANQSTANPQQIYKNASVMVARKQDHESIQMNLRRYNIQGIIVTPFQDLRLRGAANSSIFYHKARFEELLSVVSGNREFQFNNKKLLVISITDYIRLTERNQRNIMNEADFNSLGGWLHKKYPHEPLKMWKFITDEDDQEFYIQTGSKESSLYIYIVMTQFLERSSFKNPKGLERMDEQERAVRFQQYYICR